MKLILLASLLTLPVSVQDPVDDEIDPKLVEAAVERLETVFKKGESAAQVAAIQECTKIDAPPVAEAIAKGLKERDVDVKLATIEALRWMESEPALESLEKYYKKDKKKLHKDAKLLPPLLKAIGQHGSPSSIEILTEDPFGVKNYAAIQARLYGLGNIRTLESLEALISMCRKVSPNQLEDFMDILRLSLFNLTGEDNGNSIQLWGKWWQDNKKGYELPEKAPKMSESQQAVWDEYWGYDKKKKEKKDGDGD